MAGERAGGSRRATARALLSGWLRRRGRGIEGRLVGRDFARSRPLGSTLRAGALGWLVVVACVCALGLAALRIDILRMRYALGDAVQEERSLALERGRRTAQVESLRDPTRLAELARQRGFGRPERVLELRPQLAQGRQP